MKSIEGSRAGFVLAVAVAVVAGMFTLLDGRSTAVGTADVGDRADRTRVEAAIARTDVTGKLMAALGDDFGGTWFDPSSARLHVGVTSPADRAVAEATAERAGLGESVIASRVRSTWQELLAGQERLNDHLADLFERAEVSTGLRADLNAVHVELGSAVPSARRAALEAEAAAAGVETLIEIAPRPHLRLRRQARCNAFEAKEARCDPTIVAGVSIESAGGKLCTAGPAVRPTDHKKPTETFIMTAGHCIQPGGVGVAWFAWDKAGNRKEIGKSVEWKNGATADVGLIRVNYNPGNWASAAGSFIPVEPTIAPWNEAAPEPQAVKGTATAEIGAKVCLAGQKSGRICGKILKTNAKVEGTEELVEVEAASDEGDSGGPWYSEAAIDTVLGTHVGQVGGNAAFEPISTSFSVLGTAVELLKESNKSRHPFKLETESAPATLTGKQPAGMVKLTTTAGIVECTIASYTGMHSAKAASYIALTPSYAGCTLNKLLTTVNANGCTYHLAATRIVSGNREGSLDINCPAGKAIVFTSTVGGVPKCTIHLGMQLEKNSVTFTNAGAGATRELTADLSVGGLAYTQTAGTAPENCTNLSSTTGLFSATIQITGESGASHVGVFSS